MGESLIVLRYYAFDFDPDPSKLPLGFELMSAHAECVPYVHPLYAKKAVSRSIVVEFSGKKRF